MADPRTTPREDKRDSAHRRIPVVVRSVPSTHSAHPVPQDSPENLDILDASLEPTDDTPTTISRNTPRPMSGAEDDIRGQRLAHFELIEQIGVGGMAAVLKARDTQLDRPVALKILPPDMAADPENIRRFHQEARAAAKLDHENVARVFFCGEDQGLHFIAFEFVEGENLRQVMDRKGGRLGVAESLSYILQVAAGLAHAAQRGVVHRDIKPSNIIITPTGRAKLVDMGLARSLERQNGHSLTHSGVTLGTFDYISPEQALEPREADERSDIYSLGCTLYHMLTGRAPVPDGTAARKLHHHQHVKPVDPREFVPDLPDEVVLILDRMMAKKIEDRYQKASQLVQHLLQVARKLQVKTDAPEGVLFVETPPVPRKAGRGYLLAFLAVVTVLGLIFLLESYSKPEPVAPLVLPRARVDLGSRPAEHPEPLVTPPLVEQPGMGIEPPAAQVDRRVYDSEAPGALPLNDWLKANRLGERLEITLGRDVELRTSDDPVEAGLLLRATQEVVLKAAPGTRPTIRIQYEAFAPIRQDSPAVWAALTVDAPTSRIEGVRILLHDIQSEAALVGLLIRKPGNHTVHHCDFIQVQPELKKGRLASVLYEPAPSTTGSTPQLTLTECSFLGYAERQGGDPVDTLTLRGVTGGGLDAVVARGPANVLVRNCLIGPHLSAFTLAGQRQRRSQLTLEHNTVTLGLDSAVVHLPDTGSARLEMRHNLVTRLVREPGSSCLVRQASDSRDVMLLAQDNRYQGLDAYWRVGERTEISPDQFATDLSSRLPGSSDDSTQLEQNPWLTRVVNPLLRIDPLTLNLQKAGPTRVIPEEPALFQAFQVSDRLRELRSTEDIQGRLIGAERRGEQSAIVRLPGLDEPLTARHERVVDPTMNDQTNGIYPTLDKAILDALPGDVILIRHNGTVPLSPQRLEKASIDLTIRAETGYAPVLSLDVTTDPSPALFHLHDGKLRLEGLEIRLQPTKPYRSMTLVAFYGQGQCTLQDCLVTLDPSPQESTQVSLAVLPDNEGVMKMESRTPVPPSVPLIPRLVLEDSMVRGLGDLLRGRVLRSVDVEMRNTVVALSGTVLSFEDRESFASAPTQATLRLGLNRVTLFTTGHFLHLKANRILRTPPQIQVTTADCLFLPATMQTALLRLEGTELTDLDRLRERLEWKATRGNAYGNYAILLEQPSHLNDQPLNQETWAGVSGEQFVTFRARLATSPGREPSAWVKALPGQFKPMDAGGVGADVIALQRSLHSSDTAP